MPAAAYSTNRQGVVVGIGVLKVGVGILPKSVYFSTIYLFIDGVEQLVCK